MGIKCISKRVGLARITYIEVFHYYSMKRRATSHMREMQKLNLFFFFNLSELAKAKALTLRSVDEYVGK